MLLILLSQVNIQSFCAYRFIECKNSFKKVFWIFLYSAVKLEKPSISLTSPYAMVVFSPDKVSVNKGNAFSVTCSTHSRYPGGYFLLMKSNKTTAETKQAFGHSIFYLATFEFAEIDYKHQGDYTCVFGVNVSSLSFCSIPSKSLQVTVVCKKQRRRKLSILWLFWPVLFFTNAMWFLNPCSYLILVCCRSCGGCPRSVTAPAGCRFPGLETEMARCW